MMAIDIIYGQHILCLLVPKYYKNDLQMIHRYLYNILQMKNAFQMMVILFCLVIGSLSARADITDTFNNLLKRNLTYRVVNGYEDVDKYMPGETASVYYSLWECLVRNFSDHSTPVIFFLSGGPGLSSQHAAYREFGPIEISYQNGVPTGDENPFSWIRYGHLIFVDQPIGVGFSYNKGKIVDNTQTVVNHFINFLINFMAHNSYGLETNPFILAGEGYAGHYIPAIFQAVNTNVQHSHYYRSLKFKIRGAIIGGGWVDPQRQGNYYESVLGSAGIVSQRSRNMTQQNSNQVIIKIKNTLLAQARPYFDQIVTQDASNRYYNGMDINNYKKYNEDSEGKDYERFLIENKKLFKVIPDNVTFVPYNRAINVAFTQDIFTSFASNMEYMLNSTQRILIYNGQNDFIYNTAGALNYLQNLEWVGSKDWKNAKKQIWKESGRVKGWLKRYKNFMFVVVRNAGHYAYEDDTSIDRSIYLMLGNYFYNRW